MDLNKAVMEMQPNNQGGVARIREHCTFHFFLYNIEQIRTCRCIVVQCQWRLTCMQTDVQNGENQKHELKNEGSETKGRCHVLLLVAFLGN